MSDPVEIPPKQLVAPGTLLAIKVLAADRSRKTAFRRRFAAAGLRALSEGEVVKILDFGIASGVLGASRRKQEQRASVGTGPGRPGISVWGRF